VSHYSVTLLVVFKDYAFISDSNVDLITSFYGNCVTKMLCTDINKYRVFELHKYCTYRYKIVMEVMQVDFNYIYVNAI
jgi:hypothetical protein